MRLREFLLVPVLCLVLVAPAVRAQQADPDMWITDLQPNVVRVSGSTAYLGGAFTRVAPQAGGYALVSASDGSLDNSWPKVTGGIYAAVSDGAGGWYLGGGFRSVGGQPRAGLAHVLADHSVAPWNPGCDGLVRALTLVGSTLYVGGDFTRVGGHPRSHLAAIDISNALATSWNPGADAPVWSMLSDGTTLYVGGQFHNIHGVGREALAAVDIVTATPNSFDAQLSASGPVTSIAMHGGVLYVAGFFSMAGGQFRSTLAALDATTGVATAFDASPDGRVGSIAFSGSTLYVCGDFFSLQFQAHRGLGAVDAVTGAPLPWSPLLDGSVSSVAVAGGTVFAGGSFLSANGQPRGHAAAFDESTGALTAWDPEPFVGPVTIVPAGAAILLGGELRGVGGVARSSLAAIDLTTGQPTPFAATFTGVTFPFATPPVLRDILVTGGRVYAAGEFTAVNSSPASAVAALDAVSGTLEPWDPGVSGGFPPSGWSLAAQGSTIILGGEFTSAGGQPRRGLVALDAVTASATTWDPTAGAGPFEAVRIQTMHVNGSTIHVGGMFANMGGQPRSGAAEVDLSSGLATAWNPSVGGDVRAIEPVGSSVYIGGGFFSLGGETRIGLGAVDAVSGAALPWQPLTAFGQVYALAIRGATAFVGGTFSSIGGADRTGLAEVDLSTGLATPFDARLFDQGATCLALTPDRLLVGGLFSLTGDVPAAGFASLFLDAPLATDLVTPSGAFTCISSAHPSVGIDFGFSRTVASPVLAYSVTFQLSPELMLAGPAATSITEGPFLGSFPTTNGTLFHVTDNGGGSYTVDHTLLGDPCGPTGGGILFHAEVQSAFGFGPGSMTVTDVSVRDCANTLLPGSPGPAFTLDIALFPPASVGVSTNRMRTGNPAGDPTTAIAVTLPSLPAGHVVRVYRKGFGNHPEYDDGPVPGSVPAVPVTELDAQAAGWVLALTAAAPAGGVVHDEPPVRDFWYYVAYAEDACGNVSTANEISNGVLDYALGDVHDGLAACTGDSRVSTSDVSFLGANYGITLTPGDPRACLDVGPTTDRRVESRPTTDDRIQFEDLVMFAINFGTTQTPATRARPAAGGTTSEVALQVPALPAVGETFEAALELSSSGTVKCLSAQFAFDPAVLEWLDGEAGELLTAQGAPGLVLAPGGNALDVALLGTGLNIVGSGPVARVRFRVKAAGDAALRLVSVDARDGENRPVAMGVLSAPGSGPLPTHLAFGPPSPNPFHGQTTFRFALPHDGDVSLDVFDLSGRRVASVLRGVQPAGERTLAWDGRDEKGARLAPGLYMVRLAAGGRRITRRVMLVP